ncbi:MAG TPA: hypothetical protein VM537_08290 [Anaerolineae bacterium]|nr:hypothetical protein [Anaerolineae bacterium]
MSWTPERFGDTWLGALDLPTMNLEWQISSDDSFSPYIDLPDGTRYNAIGTARAKPTAGRLTYGADAIYTSLYLAEVSSDMFKALRGVNSKLWINNNSGSDQRWRNCTLRQVRAQADRGNPLVVHYEFVFESDEGGWQGTGVDFTTTINASPKLITCMNWGSRDQHRGLFIVTAGGTNITALTLGAPLVGWEWLYSGTILVGQQLEIHCANRTVKNNGINGIKNWHRTANHVMSDWMKLVAGGYAPGIGDPVYVTLTGGVGTSTIRTIFDYAND